MPEEHNKEAKPVSAFATATMVKVIAGRAKGNTGKVLTVNPEKHTMTVEHANIIKKHTRPNPQKNVSGGILEKEGPHARLERDAALPGLRQAHARRPHDSARRHKGARLPPLQRHV